MGHALTHGFHHTCAFHTHGQRHGQSVDAAALVNVDEVQPNRVVLDANLTWARFADFKLNEFELFGAAVFVDADGFGKDSAHGFVS